MKGQFWKSTLHLTSETGHYPRAIRTDLSEVSVYGYDYDYTLASYKKGVEYLIHDIAKQHLVKSVALSDVYNNEDIRIIFFRRYGYPESIAKLVYDPHFPIRGKIKPLCSDNAENYFYKFTLSKLSEK